MDDYRREQLKILGRTSREIHALASADIDDLVHTLISEAVKSWRASGWHRWNDQEINCAVQLYRWCQRVQEDDEALDLLTIDHEWVQLTPEILEGRATANRALRPDFRVRIGRTAARLVECKRLRTGGAWSRKYVHEGMWRFISGAYASADGRGLMVGFVQSGDVAALLASINRVVLNHADLDADDCLRPIKSSTVCSEAASLHLRNDDHEAQLTLDHFHINLVAAP